MVLHGTLDQPVQNARGLRLELFFEVAVALISGKLLGEADGEQATPHGLMLKRDTREIVATQEDLALIRKQMHYLN